MLIRVPAMRRAQDAIAEIHFYGTRGYERVLDADIEAAFDNVSHPAVMDRVRARVKDKRVLALVKKFLKTGVLTELGEHRDTLTGTPQGGILSPLIFNIAMTVLDEHLMAPWRPGGDMSTGNRRTARRRNGLPTWRLVRYADLCRRRHKSALGYSLNRSGIGSCSWSSPFLHGRFAAGRSRLGG